MITKNLFKRPILPLGILFFIIFIYKSNLSNKIFWKGIIPTSCRGAKVPLENYLKNHKMDWNISCNGNNLMIEVKQKIPPKFIKKEKEILYKQLANYLHLVSTKCNHDALKNVDFINFSILGLSTKIVAITEGKYFFDFYVIKEPNDIKQFLQQTVKVSEFSI